MKLKNQVRHIIILTKNYSKILLRDKMNLFWFLIFPIIIALLFGYLVPNVGGSSDIILCSKNDNNITSELLETYPYIDKEDDANKMIQNFDKGYSKVLIIVDDKNVDIYNLQSENEFVDRLIEIIQMHNNDIKINRFTNENIHLIRPIDYIIPGVIVLTFMQIGLFGGMSVIQDRKKKILVRLEVNNVKASSIILANMFSRVLMVVIATIEIVLIGKYILLVPIRCRSIWMLSLAILLGSLTFLSIGLFISSIISNADTASIVSQCLNFPMAFIGGIFMPIEQLPSAIRFIANILPITPLVKIFRGILLEGISVIEYWQSIATLVPWILITLVLGSALFKWE